MQQFQQNNRQQNTRQQDANQLPAIPLPVMKAELAKMTPEFAKGLPGHITAERFVRTAQTAISLTRGIENVRNMQSLMAACAKAAADGLVLDGREAALVVDFRGDVQYRPMMRGLLKLARQSGEIKTLVVELALEGDEFDYVPTDPDEPITHVVDLRKDRGEVFAVYALARMNDGGLAYEVMTVADINRIRDRSDGWKAFKAGKIKSTPWSTDWSEMARKTVFRRLAKYLPSSSDKSAFASAVERIDEDFTFEAEADKAGDISTPKPAAKQRGGAAAALKNITPQEQAPAKGQDLPPHDEDGVILDGEIVPANDDTAKQDGDDI
jgi:recombination protein RecT